MRPLAAKPSFLYKSLKNYVGMLYIAFNLLKVCKKNTRWLDEMNKKT